MALLSGAAGILASPARDGAVRGALAAPLLIAALAATAGGIAATFAALSPGCLPGALADLGRNFFGLSGHEAAAPLRAALVHATSLFAFLAVRRAAARSGAAAVLRVSLAGGALVAAYAVLEAGFSLKLWPPAFYEAASGLKRVVSTLSDYNSAGAYFALLLFPAAAGAAAARGGKRLLGLSLTALLFVGLLLSGSRTAWIAAAAAGALLLGVSAVRLRRRDPSRLRRLFVGAAAAVLAAAAVVSLFPGPTGTVLRLRVATLMEPAAALEALSSGRIGFWRAGGAMLAAHPLAGVGPGRVPARFDEYRPEGFPVEAENVHNWPLQCLDENGLVGGLLLLFPFAALIPVLLREGRRAAADDGPVPALAFGLGAFLFCGLTSHPWLLPEMQFVFWGHVALLDDSRTVSADAPRAPLRFITLAAAALLVLWSVPRLVLAPGRERSRYGYGSWSPSEGVNAVRWLGPEALVHAVRPAGGGPYRVRLKAPPGAAPQVGVSARVDGGPWSGTTLVPGVWTNLVVMPPFAPESSKAALEIRARFAFCPATRAGDDRRILSVQAASPLLYPSR